MSALGLSGISAIQFYLPQYRVDLKDWCEWTGNDFAKVSKVVGHGFRMPGPRENVYSMAASALLKLILTEEIDASSIGFLGFGTESSTDNAAGAVIIKGMVDRALLAMGRPSISRHCEVPEFKHACLGGVYATKAALRWAMLDGRDRKAVVISADIAEYARGSSGEQTQGAGAVAFLIEANPRLLTIDLARAGNAAAYRGPDFRKPVARHFVPGSQHHHQSLPEDGRLRDFPVFNGRYSTHCYLDQVLHAFQHYLDRNDDDIHQVFESKGALFFHRPYHHLPTQALATLEVFRWGRCGEEGKAKLTALCEQAQCDPGAAWDQLSSQPDLKSVLEQKGPNSDPYAAVTPAIKALRRTPEFKTLQKKLLSWGEGTVKELGNLYTASLPAWLACGLADAASRPDDLRSMDILAIGYGSGDASEVLPCTLVPGWEKAASAIHIDEALAGAHTLDQASYEALHKGINPEGLPSGGNPCFRIQDIGTEDHDDFQNIGIERYHYSGH